MVLGSWVMILNSVMIDYLRLGSWDRKASYYWAQFVRELGRVEGVNPEQGGWLQYRGVKLPWAFAGVAKQGKDERYHSLLQVSGSRADMAANMARVLVDGGGKCSRIDLQVTVPMVADYLWWDRWSEYMLNASWGHRRPKIEPIPGDRGMSTLYVGSRTSERFIRFYVKELDNGDRALRFEVQYGGDMAQQVWSEAGGRTQLKHRLAGELSRLPLPGPGGTNLNRLRVALGNGAPVPTTVHEGGNTWAWINEAVDPAIKRLLGDHEHGGPMRGVLLEWLDYARKLDER